MFGCFGSIVHEKCGGESNLPPGKSCVLPDLVPAFSVGLKMFHLMLGKSVVFLDAVWTLHYGVDWLTYFICWFAKVDSSALQVSLIDASLSDYFTQHYIPKSLFAAFAWALVHVFKCVFLFTSCGSIFCFHASNSKITMGRWAGELSCAAMVCITGVTLHIPGFATESADWISCYMAIWSFAICSNEKSVSYDYVSPGCCRVRTSFDHVAAAFLERVTFSHDTWHMWYVKCKWHMSCNATRWGEIMCGWRAQHSCKHQTICRG